MQSKNGVNVNKIIKYIKDEKLSKKEFCKRCEICVETLNKILRKKTNVGIVAIFKIAKIMEIDICQLFY